MVYDCDVVSIDYMFFYYHYYFSQTSKARIFLLVDLRDFFFRFRVGGGRRKKVTGHFQSFFLEHLFYMSPVNLVW